MRNSTPRSGREAPNCGVRASGSEASEISRVRSRRLSRPSHLHPGIHRKRRRRRSLRRQVARQMPCVGGAANDDRSSSPGIAALTRHDRACPGHPRRSEIGSREIRRVGSAPPFRPHIGSGLCTTTWMTGTSPVMTIRRRLRCVEPHRSGRLRLFRASTPPRKSPIIAA